MQNLKFFLKNNINLIAIIIIFFTIISLYKNQNIKIKNNEALKTIEMPFFLNKEATDFHIQFVTNELEKLKKQKIILNFRQKSKESSMEYLRSVFPEKIDIIEINDIQTVFFIEIKASEYKNIIKILKQEEWKNIIDNKKLQENTINYDLNKEHGSVNNYIIIFSIIIFLYFIYRIYLQINKKI